MKTLKLLLIISLILFLCLPMINAEDAEDAKIDIPIKEIVKNAANNATLNYTGLLPIPAFLDAPTRLFFKIPANKGLALEDFILLVCLFVGAFILSIQIVDAIPLFDKPWIALLANFIILCILSITGSIYEALDFMLTFYSGVPLKTVITLATIAIFVLIVRWGLKFTKERIKEWKNEITTYKIKKKFQTLNIEAEKIKAKNEAIKKFNIKT